MWSGVGINEDAGRGERKCRMHELGESLKTSPIKGIIKVNLPRNEFMKRRQKKTEAQSTGSR